MEIWTKIRALYFYSVAKMSLTLNKEKCHYHVLLVAHTTQNFLSTLSDDANCCVATGLECDPHGYNPASSKIHAEETLGRSF